MIWFGPAGNSDSFAQKGYKNTSQVPEYLAQMNLNAYEYQCGRGVRVSEASALALKAGSEKYGIRLSLHSPYYISLSGTEEEKRLGSIDYILQSARAARLMGADRVVVHSGSCAKQTRQEALELAKDTLLRALEALDKEGIEGVALCPETMGKFNQLGDLDEVIELCKIDKRLVPCIDFGHLNARSLGAIKSREDYERIILKMFEGLGEERAKNFHSHFSRIEYTQNGGEKRHLTFEDSIYGPDFAPLAEILIKYDCSPVIICESAGTQAEDAADMSRTYNLKMEDYL